MLKYITLISILFVASVTSYAQGEYSRNEVYGTYSYLKADIDFLADESLQGWGAGYQMNFHRYIGFVAEFGGNYGSSQFTVAVPGRIILANTDTSLTTYLFGPRATYRTRPVNVYGHFLLGAGRNSAAGVSNTEFAMAIGGGVDVNLSRRFAIRAGQFDYLPVHSDLPLNAGGSSW